MDGLLLALTLAAGLGCGLNAGVFFAFSSFVMPALARLPPRHGVAAMQTINAAAVTLAFMLVLFGTAAVCLALTVWGIAEWGEGFGPYLVAGGALYLAGTLGLTVGYHVPRNDALAKVAPSEAELEPTWARYVSEWTALNHIRTAAGLGGPQRSPLRVTSAERCLCGPRDQNAPPNGRAPTMARCSTTTCTFGLTARGTPPPPSSR